MKNPIAWGLLGLGLLILVNKSGGLSKLIGGAKTSAAGGGPNPNTTGTGAGNPAGTAPGGDPFVGLIGAISGFAGALGGGSKGAGSSGGISTGVTDGGSSTTGNTSGESSSGGFQLSPVDLGGSSDPITTTPVYNVDGTGDAPTGNQGGSDPLGLGTLTLGGSGDE